MWIQKVLTLAPKPRGFHLITREIMEQLPEVRAMEVGLAHLLLQHTSASLTLNENADPDVRRDMEQQFRVLIPDGAPFYTHVLEGEDDMTAHVKSSLLGVSLTLPVGSGRFQLGTWQGIYLGEHRIHGGSRRLVVTLQGETTESQIGS
jgi:secondary thiamine-phosphate synthase enzyme